MRRLVVPVAAFALILLSSCAPRREAPAPTPPPPVQAPTPPQPPPPPLAWQDAPASAGDWSYRDEGGASSAAFASGSTPALVLRCEADRRISLVRAGAGGASLVVRTSSGERRLAASPAEGGMAARLAAGDPLLDDMAFSRGRFAVETEGAPLLIAPAWPEIARVIEDCRG